MRCHFFLKRIFLTKRSNSCLLHWQADCISILAWATRKALITLAFQQFLKRLSLEFPIPGCSSSLPDSLPFLSSLRDLLKYHLLKEVFPDNVMQNRKVTTSSSFLFIFNLFNWRLITLQYCHTSTWIHHRYTRVPHPETPVPPLSPYHPSGSSQFTSPKHPVSCIEPGLAIHFIYDIIHVSMPFSQIIPTLALSHRVQKTVLYICVSFAVSHMGSSLPSF